MVSIIQSQMQSHASSSNIERTPVGPQLDVTKTITPSDLQPDMTTLMNMTDPIETALQLVEAGAITANQALVALSCLQNNKPTIGDVAIQLQYISSSQLNDIQSRMGSGQSFERTAIQLGYLTEAMLAKIHIYQRLRTPSLTQVLNVNDHRKSVPTLGVDKPSIQRASDDTHCSEPSDATVFALPLPPEISILDDYGPMIAEFCQEADEHLETVDKHLLAIDSNPASTEALNAVYRGFHTIKGVSSMLNLHAVHNLAHEAENLLNLAREGKVVLQGKVLDLIFVSTDVLTRQIQSIRKWTEDRIPMVSDPGLPKLLKELSSVVKSMSLDNPTMPRTSINR